VPCFQGSHQILKDVKINYGIRWGKKHLETIRQSYAQARYSSNALDVLSIIYGARPELLVDLTEPLMMQLSAFMGFTPKWVRSQDLHCQGSKTEHIKNILKAVGADEWLANTGDKELFDPADFDIKVTFFQYQQPVYPQMHGDFVGQLSIIDLLLNVGPQAAEYVRSGCK